MSSLLHPVYPNSSYLPAWAVVILPRRMRLCLTGLRPIDGVFLPLAPAERECDIGGIGRLLEEAPKDLPRGNHQGIALPSDSCECPPAG
jgi:hypothetical protein